MAVLRANVDFAKRILADRIGNNYVYGGNWSPTDTSVGTDCSGLVVSICDAVRNGTRMAWSRHGMSTESWRPIDVGQTGTIFQTVCVASPRDFPPDAAVKIAIHHGRGGGVNSHMWCEVDGMRGESNGSNGCVTGSQAMSVMDTSFANDWHYIPGPIVSTTNPAPAPSSDQLAAVFRELTQRLPSRSIYRTPGEGPVDTLAGMLLNIDAMAHAELVERLARQGDRDALTRLARTAAGNGAVTDAQAIAQASAVLADIEKNNPSVLHEFLKG